MSKRSIPSAKKMASFIGYVIASAFVIIAAVTLFNAGKVGNIVNNKTDPYLFGYKPVIVVTGSMVPAIEINSISILKYGTIEDLKVGDVVLYKYANMKITHRVIAIGPDMSGKTSLTTKGDANKYQDQIPVTADMVEGKLVKTYNGVAPLISHFMLAPGEINSAAISQGILFLIVFISLAGVVLFHLGNTLHTLVIIVTNRKQYEKCLEDYEAISEMHLKLKEEVTEILNSDKKSMLSLMVKAKTIKGINELTETMKDFEKRLKFIRWVHRVMYKRKK